MYMIGGVDTARSFGASSKVYKGIERKNREVEGEEKRDDDEH